MDKAHNFKPGDVVTLKGEAHPMTVVEIENPFNMVSKVTCVWLDANYTPKMFPFPYQCIRYYSED